MRALLAAAALLAATAAAQPQDWNCDDPGNLPQQGMNFCAARDFERADRALNVAWSKVREAVAARDADLPETLRGWPEALLAAQRAWIGYRDGHCTAEGFQFRGGTMEPLIVATCKARLTRQRTEELLLLVEAY